MRELHETYILERLNNFVHVNDLTIVGLEREIDIHASDLVRRHWIDATMNDREIFTKKKKSDHFLIPSSVSISNPKTQFSRHIARICFFLFVFGSRAHLRLPYISPAHFQTETSPFLPFEIKAQNNYLTKEEIVFLLC